MIFIVLVIFLKSLLGFDESKIHLDFSKHQVKNGQVGKSSGLSLVFLGGISVLLASGAILLLKKSKVRSPRQKSHIKMSIINWLPLMHGHHLAVLQVGGEFILISVGKNQVSYIKTLTIMDDEWVNENFDDNFKQELVREVISTNYEKS